MQQPFSTVCRDFARETVKTVSNSGLRYTRLKPGENEIGLLRQAPSAMTRGSEKGLILKGYGIFDFWPVHDEESAHIVNLDLQSLKTRLHGIASGNGCRLDDRIVS